jgi:membrane-associated phospholipid phosphatase
VSSVPRASKAASSQPAGMAAIAFLIAIALIILGSLVGSGPLPVDLSIREALRVGSPVRLPLDLLNTIGDPLVWDGAVALVAAAVWLRGRRIEATWIAGGLILAELLATAIKVVVDRPRPPGIVVTDWITQASFPSGHATRAAATGILFVMFWPFGPRSGVVTALVALVAILVAGSMGLARIVDGEHWPTDVLGAYLLVGALAAAAAAMPERIRRTGPARPAMPAVETPGLPPPPGAPPG